MPHFDAIGITAEDLPATLAFYRLIGLDVPETDEGHVEAELTGGFRIMKTKFEIEKDYE